jgi:hypothetical protein
MPWPWAARGVRREEAIASLVDKMTEDIAKENSA